VEQRAAHTVLVLEQNVWEQTVQVEPRRRQQATQAGWCAALAQTAAASKCER
jgi:hypothetical protein